MEEQRFPYETNRWDANTDKKREWWRALEDIGPENVRATLAVAPGGSRAMMEVGGAHMTKGFAQDWLAWSDARKAEREARFRSSQIFWSRWTAFAATGTALVAAVGWIIALLLKRGP
jgi:hypothetical protein